MSFDKFVAIYLDWCNNYLSIPFFADSYGITVEEATRILTFGKQIRDLDIEIGHLHKKRTIEKLLKETACKSK